MSVPTQGEVFAKLIENLVYAQEHSATLAHLANANDDTSLAKGWLMVSENFRKMQRQITQLATGGRLQ